MSKSIEEIIECLRFYALDLELGANQHKRIHLFPQNLGEVKWNRSTNPSQSFKEPKRLRCEGAKSALEAMANHFEYCLEKGLFE